jgi:hypothetical protein
VNQIQTAREESRSMRARQVRGLSEDSFQVPVTNRPRYSPVVTAFR